MLLNVFECRPNSYCNLFDSLKFLNNLIPANFYLLLNIGLNLLTSGVEQAYSSAILWRDKTKKLMSVSF